MKQESKEVKKYLPSEIEEKWQKVWEEIKVYQPDLDKVEKSFGSAQDHRPFYNLMMFPYPSAEGMHVGNMYAFTGSDIYGRFKRMQGYAVFEPIGLDGFGIHSENYAIKVGRHPKEQAKISEENFYRQLRATGNGFDWSRKVETYDPGYYKWTQWIFVQLFKQGLAYRKKAPVNFCPSCKTVLADEQVIENKCERCGSIVEKRELEQWFFKITNYAERLLSNLDSLDWTTKVKIAQENWIGKKEGARIRFVILNSFQDLASLEIPKQVRNDTEKYIEVFTTRPDTLYGATFLVLSPEHPIIAEILKQVQNDKKLSQEIKEYIENAKKKSEQERIAKEREKTGIFSGLYAVNPLNDEKIPVWIADYALMSYGTGALFGDAHDERDFQFAKKYKIPLKPTVITGNQEQDRRIINLEECFTGEGTLIDSGEFSGLTSKEAKKKIVSYLTKKGSGGTQTTYHLRDWLISRQRYWGPPIPMIHCKKCAKSKKGYFEMGSEKLELDVLNSRNLDIKDSRSRTSHFSHQEFSMYGWFPVPEKDLPVLLPEVEDWRPEGTGTSPLANHPEFYQTTCPKCRGEAKRETDVSDNFLDSAWYFFRYIGTEFDTVPFASEAFSEYSENSVSQKVRSSDTSDNQKVRSSDSSEFSEAMKRSKNWLPVTMYIGGAEHSVLHLLYSRFLAMVFKDLGLISFEEPFSRFYAHGLLIKEGAKMSKSKGNVVIPDAYIKKYGADALRAYLMFAGPFNLGGDFQDTGIEGMHRFLKRVWTLVDGVLRSGTENFFVPQLSRDEPQVVHDDIGARQDANRKNFVPSPHSSQIMHKTIKKVTEDIEHLRYNTAIATLMEYYNSLAKQEEVSREEVEVLLKLLAPFAPHMTEELWERIKNQESRIKKKNYDSYFMLHDSIHVQPWPKYDPKMLEEGEVIIVIQIDGKVRDTIRVQNSEFRIQNKIEERARGSQRVKKYLEGKKIKKMVYVEGKVINFATSLSS